MNRIREILARHGRLGVDVSTLATDDDLYRAGLTSHACVAVMLSCEDEFDVTFPGELIKRSTFASMTAIAAALRSCGAELDEMAAR